MSNSIESIRQFKQNWLNKHPDEKGVFAHNVYHIISEDMDGNITDEKFGVNCMTNNAFGQYYAAYGIKYPYVYIGTGTSIPTPASYTMDNPISTTAAIGDYYWDMGLVSQDYDSTTGITTSTFRAKRVYFDYTVFAEDKNITEIGMGNSVNDLMFHARVYDASGDPATIVKHVNERLYITVYVTTGMKVKKMVEDAWLNGVYKLISPHVLSWPYGGLGQNPGQVRCSMTPNNSNFVYDVPVGDIASNSGTVSNNIYTRDIQNFGSCLMENQRSYIDNITLSDDGGGYVGKYILTFKPRLSTALELTGDVCTGFNRDDFYYIFGWPVDNSKLVSCDGVFPVIDADIQSSKMYNFTTHAWDIADTFVNPTTAQYDAFWLVHSIKYYFTDNGTLRSYRVYLNQHPDIPITKIENHGIAIYATDEYWDPSTLTLIDDPNNVSNALGTKKFYCTFANSMPACSANKADHRAFHGYVNGSTHGEYTIYTERSMTLHSITPVSQPIDVDYGEMSSSDIPNVLLYGKMVSNDTLGYIACAGVLTYPESVDPNATGGTGASASLPYKYRLYGHDGTTISSPGLIWNTTTGDKVIVASNINVGVRVYDVTSTASSAPTSTAYTFPTAFSSCPAISTSDKGWFVASYSSGANNVGKTYVLSAGVTGVADDMYEVSGYDTAFCIDLTDYMCGHNYNAASDIFDIYDMKTKTVVSSFTLDSRYSYLNGGCGFKDYVYIRVHDNSTNTNKTCLYYISDDRLVVLDIDLVCMTFNTNADGRCVLCVDSPAAGVDAVMVIIGTTQSRDARHMIIKESTPETPIKIADISGYESSPHCGSWFGNISDNSAQLKYVGNQLLLCVNTSEYSSYYGRYDVIRGPMVYNIGYVCDNGTMTSCYCWPFTSSANRQSYQSSCLYKNWVVRSTAQTYAGSPRKYYSWYKLVPIERYVPHRVTLRTRTINAYNNPVRVSNIKRFTYQVSNDTSIYEPPV